jgi:hypothetical protein
LLFRAAGRALLPADGLDPVLAAARHHQVAALARPGAADQDTNRTPFDALLYAAVLVLLVIALLSDGAGPIPALGTTIGVLPWWQTVAILSVLAVLGLRDKIIFLAARGEVYAPLALTFLFSGADTIIGAKVVFIVIWLGAATSKLNKHFSFVISTMLANNPFIPSGFLKRSSFKRYPDDLRPSALAGFIAHFSTAVEGLVRLVLFFSHGGWPTAIAAFIMIVFHLNILLAFPMGVPLEWNVFMIFGVLWLFVAHAHLGLSNLTNPLPVAVLLAVVAGTVVIGNLYPRKVSFLPGMRYYAGNWGTTVWCVKPSVDEKFRTGSARSARCITCSSSGCAATNRTSWSPFTSPRVPGDEHPWARAVHPGAPRAGGLRRGRLQPV